MVQKLASLILWVLALSLAGPTQDRNPRILKGWGEADDPDGDCKITLRDSEVTISVPGTLHDLSAELGKINAPRILRDIEGDFKELASPSTAESELPRQDQDRRRRSQFVQ